MHCPSKHRDLQPIPPLDVRFSPSDNGLTPNAKAGIAPVDITECRGGVALTEQRNNLAEPLNRCRPGLLVSSCPHPERDLVAGFRLVPSRGEVRHVRVDVLRGAVGLDEPKAPVHPPVYRACDPACR